MVIAATPCSVISRLSNSPFSGLTTLHTQRNIPHLFVKPSFHSWFAVLFRCPEGVVWGAS